MADFNTGRVWAAWATPGYRLQPEQLEKINKLCDEWRGKGLCATDKIGGWPGGLAHLDLKTAMDEEIKMMRLVDDRYRLAFEDAQRMAHSNTADENPHEFTLVDEYLHMAGIKNKPCGMVLQIATGSYVFPPVPSPGEVKLWELYKIDYIAIHYAWARTYLYWPPETVREHMKNADWTKARKALQTKKANIGILHSARKFLETCGEMDLGIRFTAQ